MLAKFKMWYYPPRTFEGGRLYPLLGIRFFKKYLPTSGDLVSRFRGVKRIRILESGGRQAALESYEKQAWRWEYRHLVSAVLLQAYAFIGGTLISPEHFWTSTIVNLVVNIYPVMLQRYNRARVAKLRAAGAA